MRNGIVFVWTLSGILCAQGADVVFDDFEREAWAPWTVEGTAFGTGPAEGTLPNQMAVSGFSGKRLVNSYVGGDDSLGTLTSPAFTIEKPYISFLIGGGGWTGKTCMELVVDGTTVRTASGSNVQSGGSEALAGAFWDVTEFKGSSAFIRIADRATGGWGHINVDAITFTDVKPALPQDMTRAIAVDQDWLLFPVKNGAKTYRLEVRDGDTLVRWFDIGLAPDTADWWAPLDVSAWRGKELTLKVPLYPPKDTGFANVKLAKAPALGADILHEALRPQFHLSPLLGWNNDPNGLVYFKGEYHVFFQHNPYGVGWGNMHWGHAVSKDLLHWRHLGEALYPDANGDCFSGSGVVDTEGTAGFGNGAMALVYTGTANGSAQCLAYSLDGKTFKKYSGNPVIPNITGGNRDPRIFWYAPTKEWVLALYVGRDGLHTVTLFTSKDMKAWTVACIVPGDKEGSGYLFECPDMYELPIEGENGTRWILTAANGQYAVGTFDGTTYKPEEERLPSNVGRGYYAAQTFSNTPDGRRILLPWFQTGTTGMPFNQSMGLPQELGLRRVDGKLRMTHKPIAELETLRDGDAVPFAEFKGELVEAFLDCEPGADAVVSYSLRGIPVVYDAAKKTLTVNGLTVSYEAPAGHLSLRAFIDRGSVEIFSTDGLMCLPMPVIPDAANLTLTVQATGTVKNAKDRAYKLHSVWTKESVGTGTVVQVGLIGGVASLCQNE
jgi:fructan beta-fructosidase